MTLLLPRWSAIALMASFAFACSEGPRDEPKGTLHLRASLDFSNFEIDDDANLITDDGGIDWLDVEEIRATERNATPDDSYTGGAKENDLCPAVGTGSIPPNKSDLLDFGFYAERNGPRTIINLFWTRVQEPSGTTLMDFEFNQSSDDCGNGVNKDRIEGDLLVEYRIEAGGSVATIAARRWESGAWSGPQDLSESAIGSINTSAIPEGESDGLGPLSPRTFGEASIDLTSIVGEGNCVSFGSAFVKSRSSDSFNSTLKDFIAPIDVEISTCGGVTIKKQAPSEALAGVEFDFELVNLDTDPPSVVETFQLSDQGAMNFDEILFGNYLVREKDPGVGIELIEIDCSESVGVVADVDLEARSVSFEIDDEADQLVCTFVNQATLTDVAVMVESQAPGATASTIRCDSVQLAAPMTAETDPSGAGELTLEDLPPGKYICEVDIQVAE